MKIRVTIMTENDRHISEEEASKEEIEKLTKEGWDFVLKSIIDMGGRVETAFVESCELVER